MRRYLLLLVLAVGATLAFSPDASAQSGHFVGTPTCTDEGTFLECTGRVAGLAGRPSASTSPQAALRT
jgi:hypothetical protein